MPDNMTYEVCPHCMNEVHIPADRRTACPKCGRLILPCSACDPDKTVCNWTEAHGCARFKW